MSRPVRQSSGRSISLGVMVAVLAAALVIVSAGAFAIGRTSAPQTATQTAYGQTTSTGHGPMWTWMQTHNDAWTRAHLGNLTWIRHHQAKWQWMRGHPGQVGWMRDHADDMAWMQTHPGASPAMRWMRHQWATLPWLRTHASQQRQRAQRHPHAWSSMRHHMGHMMRDGWHRNWTWHRSGSNWHR